MMERAMQRMTIQSLSLIHIYFDASINRISAWTVGFRNVEKALRLMEASK